MPSMIRRTDDRWIMHVICKGSEEGEELVKSFKIDKTQITLGNVTTLKSKLGYGSRDYKYFMKRSVDDPTGATLHDIEYDIDVVEMIDSNQDEREIRLVFSKNPAVDRCVEITPIKKRVSSDDDEEEELQDYELDAYKDWLDHMHTRKEGLGESIKP